MDAEVFDAIRMAVNLSKSLRIQKVGPLRARLCDHFDQKVVDEALKFWAEHEKRKPKC